MLPKYVTYMDEIPTENLIKLQVYTFSYITNSQNLNWN